MIGPLRQRRSAGRRFLPKLCTMEHFASYCLTEPDFGARTRRASRPGRWRDGDAYVLDGAKAFISGGGGVSDVYVVDGRRNRQ